MVVHKPEIAMCNTCKERIECYKTQDECEISECIIDQCESCKLYMHRGDCWGFFNKYNDGQLTLCWPCYEEQVAKIQKENGLCGEMDCNIPLFRGCLVIRFSSETKCCHHREKSKDAYKCLFCKNNLHVKNNFIILD